jgi:Uma2 family endonuclease
MVREYTPQTQPNQGQNYPSLQSGDRLTRPEFERCTNGQAGFGNEPQPDAVLFIEANSGGQTRISPDGYIEGSPELIVEIAASSAAIDTGSKKQVYRRNGVLEYVIWQSYENQLEWF